MTPEDGTQVTVSLEGPLVRSRFVERPNRFLVRCRLEEEDPRHPGGPSGAGSAEANGITGTSGTAESSGAPGPVDAHLPDPGRLEELLVRGRRVWLRPADGPHRKTRWTAVLVETPDGDGLVSVDTGLPNRLVGEALERDALEEFAGWELEGREVTLGSSRLDFVLSGPEERKLALEVKSVTLVEDGVGLFPDAVTDRGARHVRELARLAGRPSWEAAVLFVVQRRDAREIRAAATIDPEFAEALAGAKEAGVRVLGRRCHVEMERVRLGAPVPAS